MTRALEKTAPLEARNAEMQEQVTQVSVHLALRRRGKQRRIDKSNRVTPNQRKNS